MSKGYDYKPIPKYNIGDLVYRRWCNIHNHYPEPIRRINVVQHGEKWYIEYYFPRERTPYGEDVLYATLEDILNAEAENLIATTMRELKGIKELAKEKGLNLKVNYKNLLDAKDI